MKNYKEHYSLCRELYRGVSNKSLYNISLKENCVELDHSDLNEITGDIKSHFEQNHDIAHSRWAKYVNDFGSIPKLNVFCRSIIGQLEEQYFNSFVKIENLHILQNKLDAPLESSWIWHYDDCPKEFLKFAVYLNDVDENNGPMVFVKGPANSTPVIQTFRDHPGAVKGYPPPIFPKSRVPQEFVDKVISEGGHIKKIIGKAGTNFLFTPNIIHKGSTPAIGSTPRLAIFMFVRPCTRKIKDLISIAKPKKANVNVKKYQLD
jgi:hypothetical protein